LLKRIQFDATVAEVEKLLIADFYVWKHASGSLDISSEEYHPPSHIQEHVEYVTPGTRLRQRNVKAAGAEGFEKRGDFTVKPFITKLPGFPNPNAGDCDIYVTADCTRGKPYFTSNTYLKIGI
jgi:tripeptidyl-peptidase-1